MALDDVRAKLSPSTMVNVAYAGQNRAAPGAVGVAAESPVDPFDDLRHGLATWRTAALAPVQPLRFHRLHHLEDLMQGRRSLWRTPFMAVG